MNSFGFAVRGLPLALPSMTQATASDLRFHPRWRAIIVTALLALVLMLYLHRTVGNTNTPTRGSFQTRREEDVRSQRLSWCLKRKKPYNDTYPLSPPERTPHGIRYRIGVIADLDTASQSSKGQTWFSYMKRGYVTISESADRLEVEWDADRVTLESSLAEKGRGMWLKSCFYIRMCMFISICGATPCLQVWSCRSWWPSTVTFTVWMTAQVWCTGLRGAEPFPG